MPLAQAHPFEPMPVTHEEEMQEVSGGKKIAGKAFGLLEIARPSAVISSTASLVFRNLRKFRSGLASCMDRGTS